MPRERREFFRDSGEKEKEKAYVIAFEGNDTERLYFEALKDDVRFNDDMICLHLLLRPRNDTKSAPKHVFAKLKREAKDEYNFKSTDELWMVIDRDRWTNIPDIISECKKHGNMFVAGSNPCFELWLLLHVKDLATCREEELDLLLTNAKVSKKRTYIDKYLSDILPEGYSKTNINPGRFLPYLDQAISRAEALDALGNEFPASLGSHVYKLVKAVTK